MTNYPFAAIVEQEKMKRALMASAVNNTIGGVLIRGDKGTAKSTAARALAEIMPPIMKTVGCRFNCLPGKPTQICDVCSNSAPGTATAPVPFINLPLGATEDRVIGSLDFERALKEGRKAFQPGLLASAHRGVVYIDEVNLLADHLVDALLDAAAMGENTIEREGLSFTHPAQIALIGTMNPEEGDLRPQLLDRFGMMVEIESPQDAKIRTEIARRRIDFEKNPHDFCRLWAQEQEQLQHQIARAQTVLKDVELPDILLQLISSICCELGIASLRADIVMNKVSRTLAALDGRKVVKLEDVNEAAELTLPHRRRRKPNESPGLNKEQLQSLMDKARQESTEPSKSNALKAQMNVDASKMSEDESTEPSGTDREKKQANATVSNGQEQGSSESSNSETPQSRRQPHDMGMRNDEFKCDDQASDGNNPEGNSTVYGAAQQEINLKLSVSSENNWQNNGKRSVTINNKRGQYMRAQPAQNPASLAIDATLRHSILRNAGALNVTKEDFHEKIRAGRDGNLIVFVVDTSGSMSALQRMEMVKAAAVSLLNDAYQKRDKVAVITFGGEEAELAVPATKKVDLVEKNLRELPTGGRTPLSHALACAMEFLSKSLPNETGEPLLVFLTDGKTNVPLVQGNDPWLESLQLGKQIADIGFPCVLIDTECGYVRLGHARELADAMQAEYIALDKLSAETITVTIRSRLRRSPARV